MDPKFACPMVSLMIRATYLDHGSHDLPGFLVEPLSIPAGVQALELCSQPVVLPQEECMHGGELRHLTGAGVPLGKQKVSFLRPPSRKGLAPLKLPPQTKPELPPTQPSFLTIFHTMFSLYLPCLDALVHHNSVFPRLGAQLVGDAHSIDIRSDT